MGHGNLANDVNDLSSVVHHLHHNEGYTIDLIVGHSRGSMVSWMYLSRSKEELSKDLGEDAYVPNFISVSGRWQMEKVLETYARFQEGFDKDGSTGGRSPALARSESTSSGHKISG